MPRRDDRETPSRWRRREMVERQIAGRGISDRAVLAAMRTVPRERFVAPGWEDLACEDRPLPIGEGQTISQPYIVAFMVEALQLKGTDRVLELGTGSGYGAAVLGEIAAEVITIERIDTLAERARGVLASLGYDNVTVIEGDGSLGRSEAGPFDAIVATASGPDVPEALKAQLAIGGRLVMPVGARSETQVLVRLRRVAEGRYEEETISMVRFVPLIGAQGWHAGAGAESAGPAVERSSGEDEA